jgi:hypothetical protein
MSYEMTADMLRRVGFDAFFQCTKFISCMGDCFTAFVMTRWHGFPPSVPPCSI